MQRSPVLASLPTYPFVRLEEAKRRRAESGVRILDFGVGDPREPAPASVREALVEALDETFGYPKAHGLPELRGAVAQWCGRRFGVELDPGREVIPTLGSKEAIFSFAQALVDEESPKDLVVTTTPGYPVPDTGARFARAELLQLPLLPANGFLPQLEVLDEGTLRRLAILWVNYPNNPTGAVAPLPLLERLASLASEHDFILASDEAYSEIYFGEPPPSALQVSDRSHVVVFNSLSKRSSMTGYRSGFVAGAAPVLDALRAFRPTVGTAPQEFVQRAAVAAWNDETHVVAMRERYAGKRALLLDAFARAGLRVAASEATLYLWVEAPEGSSESFADRLLEHGIVVAPGAYFGPAGEGYVRFALVPSEAECRATAELLPEIV